jgi:L-threonylcarbamoyladenylate synthase
MAYPTETSFALGGNALLPETAEAVYGLKGRPRDKALLLLVDGSDGLAGLAAEVPAAARRLMERFWPGPLTLVVRAGPALPPRLADERGTVALRWSSHPVTAELLRLGGFPLIGTSANRSGRPSLYTVEAVLATFPEGIALAVDAPCGPGRAGASPGTSLPSTLVDVTVSPPRILREGAISAQAVAAALG